MHIEFDAFHAASPEQRLIATQLQIALKGCARGVQADCQWLEKCGVDALSTIAPNHNAEDLAKKYITAALAGRTDQLDVAMRSRRIR